MLKNKLGHYEKRVVELMKQSDNKPVSYNEIVILGAITRKDKYHIREAINSLQDKGILSKASRKYKLTEDLSTPLPPRNEPKKTSPTLISGVFDATPLAKDLTYAFVRADDGDYFVRADDTLNAYHNDIVGIEPLINKAGKKYCIIRKIEKRANEIMTGDVRSAGGHEVFISTNRKIHRWFDVLSNENGLEGKKVLVEVSNWGNPQTGKSPGVKVKEILGLAGDPDVELIAVLKQYGLPLEFPQEVLDEANAIPERIAKADIAMRTDHRELFTFTIDPISAKDFDDAISIQRNRDGWTLYVHIADVAHYVAKDSKLFHEAMVRGNSFYFPKKVIPMLPEKISNKLCSLRPDEDKLTMTIRSDLDSNGNIIKQRMYESVIRSNFRLTYEEVDAYIDGSPVFTDQDLRVAIDESRELSRLLSHKRKQAGYLFFDLPEVEYHYDDEGFIHDFTLANETESHVLIENFMLVANEYSAKTLSKLSPMSIYRIHEDPDMNKIERLATTLGFYGIRVLMYENLNKSMQALLDSFPNQVFHKVFDRMVLRSLKKAKYSTEHIRHFGLSIEDYTHFTSPIRRLCDLVIHHLCKEYIIHSTKPVFSTSDLKEIASIASEREILADESEREINRIYKLSYMKNKVGQEYHGLVIGANSSGLIVQLDEIPVTGILDKSQLSGSGYVYRDQEQSYVNKRTGYYYQLTDKVKVIVMQVTDDVYLELSNDADAHIHDHDCTTLQKSISAKPFKDRTQRTEPKKRIDQNGRQQKMAKPKKRSRRN